MEEQSNSFSLPGDDVYGEIAAFLLFSGGFSLGAGLRFAVYSGFWIMFFSQLCFGELFLRSNPHAANLAEFYRLD